MAINHGSKRAVVGAHCGMHDIWIDYVNADDVTLSLHVFTIVWQVGWVVQLLWRL